MLRVRDLAPTYPGLGIVARKSTLETSMEPLAAYLRALEGAVHWLRDSSPLDVQEELASAGYGPAAVRSVLASLPATVAPTAEGLDVLIDLRTSVGMALPGVDGPQQIIDPRPARVAGLQPPRI